MGSYRTRGRHLKKKKTIFKNFTKIYNSRKKKLSRKKTCLNLLANPDFGNQNKIYNYRFIFHDIKTTILVFFFFQIQDIKFFKFKILFFFKATKWFFSARYDFLLFDTIFNLVIRIYVTILKNLNPTLRFF